MQKAMESVPPGLCGINSINLANYFPHQRKPNSVVYVHKRFLNDPKITKSKESTKTKSIDKKKNGKHDKSQQVNCDTINYDSHKGIKAPRISVHNESVVEHTIRFAKEIVPLVMPSNRDRSPAPVFYTIKTSKKSGKKKKTRDSSHERIQEPTYDNEKSKKVIETYTKHVKCNKECLSVKESNSHFSENNTIDDLNINQSMSCTFSEVSDRKYHRKGVKRNRNREKDPQKFAVSESFEALATEMNVPGETKIKIHLMNDHDKNFLRESIRIPVLNAIKDCIVELNNNEVGTDVKTAQRYIKCNTQKLDCILDKLINIEKKLNDQAKVAIKSPRISMKASTLEQLGADLIEVDENSFCEGASPTLSERKRRSDPVVELIGEKRSEGGSGELGLKAPTAAKLDRPNRLPARFCWTDADRKIGTKGNSRQNTD